MCMLCDLSRRRFLGSLAAASLGALIAPRAFAAEPVILGQGKYRYRVMDGWGELPPGMSFSGDCTAVCLDRDDNVYVFTKNDQDAPPLAVGRNERSWGGLDAHPKKGWWLE